MTRRRPSCSNDTIATAVRGRRLCQVVAFIRRVPVHSRSRIPRRSGQGVKPSNLLQTSIRADGRLALQPATPSAAPTAQITVIGELQRSGERGATKASQQPVLCRIAVRGWFLLAFREAP